MFAQLSRLIISIHAPRVGSDLRCGTATHRWSIYFNPRSPCGERPVPVLHAHHMPRFQSTLPVWGATQRYIQHGRQGAISIHAPRVGSDRRRPCTLSCSQYFNPRSPCGERRWLIQLDGRIWQISIHAPRVGSDCEMSYIKLNGIISIHAPRVGSDFLFGWPNCPASISIHAPRVGSDWPPPTSCLITSRISIHAPRVGSDPTQ